jgi:hypothetical protein
MIDFVDIGTLLFCDSLMFLRPDKAMDGNSSIIVFLLVNYGVSPKHHCRTMRIVPTLDVSYKIHWISLQS